MDRCPAHGSPSIAAHVAKGKTTTLMRCTFSSAWALLIAMACTMPFAVTLDAQQSKAPTEYDVKSAYLYNFGKFVRWPENQTAAGEPFSICILGLDPFGAALDHTLAGQTIDGKSITAKRISHPEEATDCRILFIGLSEESRWKEILAALSKKSILTVSEIPQFSRRGGMIQFVMEGNRVRFEVNLTAAENAGLTLSSELLKVATTVKRNPTPGA